MEAMVDVVRGKALWSVWAAHVRAVASTYPGVAIDVGTGDGRWVYRMARVHPDWFYLGVDANAAALREISFRASRKRSRGGISNTWFVRAAVEMLPLGLAQLADQITIHYPWGRLLQGILTPDAAVIGPIALLGKPGARITVCINKSAIRASADHARTMKCDVLLQRLVPAYAEVGIALVTCVAAPGPGTTWGARVGQGRPAPSVMLTGVVRGADV